MDVEREHPEFSVPHAPESPPLSTQHSPTLEKSAAQLSTQRRFGIFIPSDSPPEELEDSKLQFIGDQFLRFRHQDLGDGSSQVSTPASHRNSPPVSDISDSSPVEEIDMDGFLPAAKPLTRKRNRGSQNDQHDNEASSEEGSDEGHQSDSDNLEVEEIEEFDLMYTDTQAVIRPSTYEDASSNEDMPRPSRWSSRQDEMERETGIVTDLTKLCGGQDGFVDKEEIDRRHRRARNRWSAGLSKRTYSQSIGSESDDEDLEPQVPQDPVGVTRRIRRRVRGPGDRSSATIEDPDPVVEEDESPRAFIPDPTFVGHHQNRLDPIVQQRAESEDLMSLDDRSVNFI
ncbi:MAG: hypothetical protein M1814_001288 [Vezdaea aestivalis]|nr:MAG: hypothetical protein M1814_001288 [Vezdaea aestivalis]